MKKYKYIMDGRGVPGLPREITNSEAEQMGVAELLAAALKAGTYKEQKQKPAKRAGEE